MAFEIVDGMTGTKHISSDDLAALNTATVGKADCVLEYGDDFKLTMASANSATLGTGVGMVGGKRFWNQAATSLTIQSGTQGQKRNDLIVARYAKTSAGIESITPVVIKGAPSADAAADPEVTANDLKLWRIPLDGINAGAPVKLFDTVEPLASLGQTSYAVSSSDGHISVDVCTACGGLVFMAGRINAYEAGWLSATLTGCPKAKYQAGVVFGRNSVWKAPAMSGTLGRDGDMIVQVTEAVSNNEIWSVTYLKA
ncbi:hypothetical protein [Ellagibacter isourolithinifaciens]|uniref:hypothetical protein n=1 Tax=Ellagibacter isourolithinifaciens TaxID=2137581 RepID=UPI003A8ED392